MKEKMMLGMIAIALILMANSAMAMSGGSSFKLSVPGTEKTLTLPAAADHAPVISLGTAADPVSGKTVEGYAIVHYAKGGSGKPGGGSTCYGFMASGAKWKAVEDWMMNPTNNGGLPYGYDPFNNSLINPSVMQSNMLYDISKWEDAANGVGGSSLDILGNGTEVWNNLVADTVAPDGSNEVYFANVSESGAIAVTIVWGIFGGAPKDRELIEWDQVYDDADYTWSMTGEAGKMDFENIATHELGHSFGLSDLYSSGCAAETMYGYADFGETNKQTLNAGDIIGINKLY